MEYAQNVSEGSYKPRPYRSEKRISDGLLKDFLMMENQDYSNELPFSDLVAKEDGRFGKLLLTDDDLYYQSLSAKEAHAYWPINFNKKGWTFSKSYSREYWKNRK